jgi:hypothetical protein
VAHDAAVCWEGGDGSVDSKVGDDAGGGLNWAPDESISEKKSEKGKGNWWAGQDSWVEIKGGR